MNRRKLEQEEYERWKARIEQMRRICESLQGLQEALRPVAQGRATLERRGIYLDGVEALVSERLKALDPKKGAEMEGVSVARDKWAQIQASPLFAKPRPAMGAEVIVPAIAEVIDLTDQMKLALARVTVPPRVSDWLRATVPHYYLPFHDLFADELPRHDHREVILRDMAHAPPRHGLISAEAGLIYRHSGGGLRSWAVVLLLVILTAGVGYVLVEGRLPFAGTSLAALFPQAPAGSPAPYLVPWLAIVAGILVHALVDLQKSSLNRGRPPLFSLVLFPLWIDALAGVIVYRGLLSLLALGSMSAIPAGTATPITAFLVGYSLDSFIGLFDERWGGESERKLAAWRAKKDQQS